MNQRISRRILALMGMLVITAALPACSLDAGPVVSAQEAFARAQAGQLTIVDIRTPEEWRQTGIGQGVLRMDMRNPDFVPQLLAQLGGDKSASLALICRTGNRSAKMQRRLLAEGFSGVINIKEGMAGSGAGVGWIRQGLPLVSCGKC